MKAALPLCDGGWRFSASRRARSDNLHWPEMALAKEMPKRELPSSEEIGDSEGCGRAAGKNN